MPQTVADKIQGKTPEQLRRYEGLKKVMTLVEEKDYYRSVLSF
jgi:hypothetical protein